jgi:hypothetical protein
LFVLYFSNSTLLSVSYMRTENLCGPCPTPSGSLSCGVEEEGIPPKEVSGCDGGPQREKLEKVKVTDPGSRLMKDSRKAIQPCYTDQIAVDDKE